MRESTRRLAEEGCARAGGARRVRVELLDGEYITIDVDRKAKGEHLLDRVCDSLELLEPDYFGLLHARRGDPRVWVELGRRLSKTFKNEPWDVRLAVKFYPPEPSELQDDGTRYQLALAVRRDLVEGRLTCSAAARALLASYALQAELGDAPAPAPARAALLARLCAPDLESRVDDLYQKHKGQTPAEAELCYLECAKKLPLYGAELHGARGAGGEALVLAVGARGVAVYRDGVLLNRFPWAKITKISYNKRAYTLRLRAGECDEFETHLTFNLNSTRAGKKLWRCSVEHHMFFRRAAPVAVRRAGGLPRLGSCRLSCRRTLRQLRELPRQLAA